MTGRMIGRVHRCEVPGPSLKIDLLNGEETLQLSDGDVWQCDQCHAWWLAYIDRPEPPGYASVLWFRHDATLPEYASEYAGLRHLTSTPVLIDRDYDDA